MCFTKYHLGNPVIEHIIHKHEELSPQNVGQFFQASIESVKITSVKREVQ